MFDFHPVIVNAFIGLLAIVLLVLAWRSVSALPALPRWGLRLFLVFVVLAPFTLIMSVPMMNKARMPADRHARAPVPDDPSAAPQERSIVEGGTGSGTVSPPKKKFKFEMPREDAAQDDRAQADKADKDRDGSAAVEPPAPKMAEPTPAAPAAPKPVEPEILERREVARAPASTPPPPAPPPPPAAPGAAPAGVPMAPDSTPDVSAPQGGLASGGSYSTAPAEPPAPIRESRSGSDIAGPAAGGSTRGLGWSGTGPGGGGNSTGGGFGGLGRIGSGGGGFGASSGRAPESAGAAEPEMKSAAEREKATAEIGEKADSAPPADAAAVPAPEAAAPAAGSDAPANGTAAGDRAAPAAPVSVPPAAAGMAGEEKEDWTVVPVYYGTDRARVPNDKRVEYGYDRGRRLELGRAMVSVPKAHEVPQIERPWAITIPYFNYKIYEEKEDPKKHFILQELKTLTEAEMLALVKERLAKSARFKDHAFVFVHGYNTTFDHAVYRAAQVAYDIKFDGAPFVYSWPSGGGVASYTYDRESSAQAEGYFSDFLKLVTQKSGARHVSVIAHSMGSQLMLRVLQDLQRTRPEGVAISQIIFAAPDVDRDSFETIAGQLKDFAKGGITLYTAANDRALSVSRRFHGGIPRAGDVPAGGPLVLPGIDTIDATAVSMDALGLHHSGYAESNALLQDIGLLIQTGERPPLKRVPILQEVKTDKGLYWRYP